MSGKPLSILDTALRLDLPLDESELRVLRDGVDKAIALIANTQ